LGDADFRFRDGAYGYYHFKGDRWQTVPEEERKFYLKNTCRVLLTSARQEMVIFIPQGDDQDPTRVRGFYDGVYRYLTSVGIQEIG
jgi:hypothetical protein